MGFWMLIFMMVVSYVVSDLLAPKPQMEDAKPSDLGDFQFPTAEEGRVIPIVWGTVNIKGPNVVWYGDLREEEIEEKVKTGMFSSKEVTVGWKYHVGIQFALCTGPIDQFNKLRAGEKTAWSGTKTSEGDIEIDEPNLFGGDDFGGGLQGTLNLKMGTLTQNANTYLSGFQKVGGVSPAYSKICYLTYEQGYVGTGTSIKPWEFNVSRWPAGLTSSYKTINTWDANPIHVAYEIFTEHLGIPVVNIDTANLITAAGVIAGEGNGFSHILDGVVEAIELIKQIEEQIDGVFYLDPADAKWKVNLIRGGYVLANQPQLDDDNIEEIREYTRGGWEDTINEVRVEFTNRNDEYQRTFAVAQDPANIRIQAQRVVSTTLRFPAVKRGGNASNLAFRELRTRSYPLAKATVVANRELWNLIVGEVVSFSSTEHDVSNLPMRVQRSDMGTLEDGGIVIDLIQDVFSAADPAFSEPDVTQWTPPIQTMIAIPSDEQIAFEAPYAFQRRDPRSTGSNLVWASGRRAGNESQHALRQRSNSSGSFYDAGNIYKFLLIGTLAADLTPQINGLNFVINSAGWDSATDMLNWLKLYDLTSLGSDLANLVMINDELLAPAQPSLTGGVNVYCGVVYRGLCDTSPGYHSAGDKVYLICAGGGLLNLAYPDPPRTVNVKLLPSCRFDQLNESSATTMDVVMDDRALKPYLPIGLRFNYGSTHYPTSTFLTHVCTASIGWDGWGFRSQFWRRDFRIFDEIESVTQDASAVNPDFPAANSTVYKMEVWNDPDGTPVLLFTTAWNTGGTDCLGHRNEILKALSGVYPTRLRLRLFSKHTINAIDYESRYHSQLDFDISADSQIDGDFNLGALDNGVVSNVWTAPDTGTYTFTIAQTMPSGVIRARINGGGWTTVIAAGLSGTLVGVTAADTIEIDHTGTTGADDRFLLVGSPISAEDAYAILIY